MKANLFSDIKSLACVFLSLFILLLLDIPTMAQGGYTLEFNGSNTYVNCGNVPFSTNMTYEAWIRSTDNKGRSDIVSWGHTSTSNVVTEFRISLSNLEFGINDGGWNSVRSSGTVNDGLWHHVAVTKSGTSISLYIDGELDNTGTVPGSPSVNQTDIGVLHNGGTRESDSYFGGEIDEIRIWSDVRTPDEIRANMHKELVGNEANLLAYYQMSDGSGSSLTDNTSGSLYDGTLVNTPDWKTSGALSGSGMCLDFDGIDDYVEITSPPSWGTNMTLEAWIKIPSVDFVEEIIGLDHATSGDIVEFRVHNSRLQFGINDGSWYAFEGSKDPTDNQWHHVAVVKADTVYTLYMDGEDEGSYTITATVTIDHMVIGNLYHLGSPYGGASNYEFTGNIDEVRIWSTARSLTELQANMFRTLEGDETGLEAYYRFDQQPNASHTTLHDITGNGHNGTLNDTDATLTWVTSDPFNTWIGSEDSDWSNGDNWSRGSAPSGEDVGIFAWNDSTNMPASATISARNFSIASGATLSHSGDLTLSGNLYNEGSFTTTGTVTFSGSTAQTIEGSGSLTAGTFTLNNANGLSMEQDVTTTTSLTLTSGVLSIGANTLTINGAISQSSGSLTGGSTSNISIGGSGASTSLPAVSLNNLTLNRANGISLSGTVSVAGALTLTNGVLNLNSQMLDVGSSGSISGTPGSSNHIQATSGSLRKNFSGTGSFNFPTGDGSNYTPISLNFSSGSFTSAYTDISLTTSKHPNNSSSTDFLSRYWTVSSSGISGFSCDVTATYANGDINGTESNMVGGKWDGSWTDLGAVTAGSNLISGTVTSFSDFTAGEPIAFPVEWLSFTARQQGQQVWLDWTTASEQQADFFAIERSTDQQDWQALGQITAKGQSSTPQSYRFEDAQPQIGRNYYRIRQVDFNGAMDYSSIVQVYLGAAKISLYPNPVQDQLTIRVNQENSIEAIIRDVNGRIVKKQLLKEDLNELDLSDLSSGVFLLQLRDQKGWSLSEQFIKE